MILLLASAGIIGLVAFYSYGPKLLYPPKPSSMTTTQVLNENISNGYRFRDVTYTDKIDIAHPDVKNNLFYYQGTMTRDRGDNGIPRGYAQLYEGSSEITQVSVFDHLYL